ncbi:hypothetical protein EJ06DRAFT_267501 [Trichodelitschia bisporula]|uniref:Uncharacterized protein n=1 Tax=Trichodelitschia bisporula TaxID=703511 RepID=A0A6G1HIS9_9PEZI|nr:hypothetical protein EJ06DRAFT_267501 [Trichodelitschia bisporula]
MDTRANNGILPANFPVSISPSLFPLSLSPLPRHDARLNNAPRLWHPQLRTARFPSRPSSRPTRRILQRSMPCAPSSQRRKLRLPNCVARATYSAPSAIPRRRVLPAGLIKSKCAQRLWRQTYLHLQHSRLIRLLPARSQGIWRDLTSTMRQRVPRVRRVTNRSSHLLPFSRRTVKMLK